MIECHPFLTGLTGTERGRWKIKTGIMGTRATGMPPTTTAAANTRVMRQSLARVRW